MRDLDLQTHVVETGKFVFGDENMVNPQERLFRFAEEAIELMQACGLKFEQLAQMAAYQYYSKSKGEIPQEIAGVHCTLLSLAESHGIIARIETLKEMERIIAKRDQCRAKHDAKPASMKAA